MTDFWSGFIIGAWTCAAAIGAAYFVITVLFRRDPVEDYPAHGEWPRVPGAGALDNQQDGRQP